MKTRPEIMPVSDIATYHMPLVLLKVQNNAQMSLAKTPRYCCPECEKVMLIVADLA